MLVDEEKSAINSDKNRIVIVVCGSADDDEIVAVNVGSFPDIDGDENINDWNNVEVEYDAVDDDKLTHYPP